MRFRLLLSDASPSMPSVACDMTVKVILCASYRLNETIEQLSKKWNKTKCCKGQYWRPVKVYLRIYKMFKTENPEVNKGKPKFILNVLFPG